MRKSVKAYLKRRFPKFVFVLCMKKFINADPDLYMLNNLKKYLSKHKNTKKFLRYLSDNQVVIDVGACSGEYSYVLAKHFQHVLSIEPTPEAVLLLKKILPRNCEILECALGESSKQVCLRIPKVGDQRVGALATIADHDFDFSDINSVENIIVNRLTIDSIVYERKIRPSFIKIDVEGYELNVLYGALKAIENYKPLLMIEIEKRHNKDYKEIFNILHNKGYVPYYFYNKKLCILNRDLVSESYEYLKSREISGMTGIINSRISEHYINNFLFLPEF